MRQALPGSCDPFTRMPSARGAADAAEERQRHADDQRARARHHQEGEPAQHPVATRALPEQQRRHDGEQRGHAHHGGGVVAREAGDEVLGACAFFSAAFSTSSRMRLTVDCLERLGRAHGEQAGQVHAARDDLVAGAAPSRGTDSPVSAAVSSWLAPVHAPCRRAGTRSPGLTTISSPAATS